MKFSMFILICIIFISILTLFCFIRAVVGPKLTDRIMAVNMIGTMTIAVIMLMAVLLDESSILDVALVYAVISFVAVIVLTQIYVGIHHEARIKKSGSDGDRLRQRQRSVNCGESGEKT